MLELWEMQSTPSFPSLPGQPSPGLEAHSKVISMDQIEQFDIETLYLC